MTALPFWLAVLSVLSGNAVGYHPPSSVFDKLVAKKILAMAKTKHSSPRYPIITSTDGVWQWGDSDNWVTGFLPSTLYQLEKRECMCPGSTAVGGEVPDWLALGRTWSAGIPALHWNNNLGHDVGFVSWPFAEEYSLNPKNQSAKENIIEFALELSSRFSSIVGCSRSWNGATPNSPSPATDFRVIIDNLMTLEVLMQAYKLTGNKTFYNVATTHADTTLKNHFRHDWSSWHVVNYDSETGAVKQKVTRQGYSDNSTWTRGESWGIYSYARLYQYTKKKSYLTASRNIAAYFLRRTPKTYMPWDFDAPAHPTPPADSSAAMVAAAGLQLLASAEASIGNDTGAAKWMSSSHMLIEQTAKYAWDPSWQSLLANATKDNHGIPHSNNTGLPYGDFFWVKTGNFLLASGQTPCPSGKKASVTGCGMDLVQPAL